MKAAPFLLAAIALAAAFAGCTHKGSDHVAFLTSEGCIVLELYPDDAPKTVENFVSYVEDGFYDGTVFHRIMQNFVIQGGGFDEEGNRKETKAPIPLEYKLPNEKYTLSMARTDQPNSATSQFFINTKDNTQDLGPIAGRSDGYAVFGKVIEGQEVVDSIAAHPVGPNPANPREMSDPEAPAPKIIKGVTGKDCPEDPGAPAPVYGVDAGLITATEREDGVWETVISNATDYVPLWVINTGNAADKFTAMHFQTGDWNLTFNPGVVDLQAGERRTAATTAYLTIQYEGETPVDTTDTRFRVVLKSSGDANTTKELLIRPVFDEEYGQTITKKGDKVEVDYRGTFDDGEEFDAGTLGNDPRFVPVVGGTNLVPGFSMGMLGMALNETVQVRFPPHLGYGFDPAAAPEPKFAGAWLNFEITLNRMIE